MWLQPLTFRLSGYYAILVEEELIPAYEPSVWLFFLEDVQSFYNEFYPFPNSTSEVQVSARFGVALCGRVLTPQWYRNTFPFSYSYIYRTHTSSFKTFPHYLCA